MFKRFVNSILRRITHQRLLRKYCVAEKDWEVIQDKLIDLPGEEGIRQRRKKYRHFFLRLGKSVVIERNCRFYKPDRISLDDNVRINRGALIYGSGGVHIGRNVLIGPRFFLHSANHDTVHGATSFSERSYLYDTVEIGDNSLISANVKIMPGANLGGGTFVAAGALVPQKKYAPNSRLKGIPVEETNTVASNQEQSAELPLVGILTPRGNYPDKSLVNIAVRTLIESLGLPQVRLVDFVSIPLSVQAVILVGPDEWISKQYHEFSDNLSFVVWRLSVGKAVSEVDPVNVGGRTISLPLVVSCKWVPAIDKELPLLENLTSVSLYYSKKRLVKSISLTCLIYLEWVLLVSLLPKDLGGENLCDIILKKTVARSGVSKEILRQLGEPGIASDLLEMIQGSVKRPKKITVRSFLLQPHLALLESLLPKDKCVPTLITMLTDSISYATKASQVAIYGLASYFLKNKLLFAQAQERILNDFLEGKTWYVQSSLNSSAFCYDPALTAFLFLAAQNENPSFAPSVGLTDEKFLRWELLKQTPSSILSSSGKCLVDCQSYTISRSLFDNWRDILEPPVAPPGTQLELEDANYNCVSKEIELIWLEVFKAIFGEMNRPLIQVQPWPYPYKAALSLRYDVDRPLNSFQVRSALGIQREKLNAGCATWYFSSLLDADNALQQHLTYHNQELAIHALKADDPNVANYGVSFHSGIGAEYWRGKASLNYLAKNKAKYGEYLSIQSTCPRMLESLSNEKKSHSLWIVPIHFPLEGGVNNKGLEYFDELLNQFQNVRSFGGHLILASHPDVDQSHLVRLIRREQLAELWCGSIEKVIERYADVMCYGSIGVANENYGEFRISSKKTIADLRVVVFPPKGDIVQCDPIQLNAGFSRIVSY